MKRKNLTRNALFTSIMSLLLCVSMLVGTTFAWFTDSVVSGVNTIAAGNLDVELYHGKDANPVDKVKSDTLLFTDVGGNVIDLWEPGVVAFTNLKVANEGTLALKYQLSINSTEMNTVKDTELTLADALKVAVVRGGVSGTREQVIGAVEDNAWTKLESFTLSDVLEADKKSETYGIIVYWMPVDNEYDNQFNMNNGKTTSNGEPLTITLGVNLFATQEMYEDDSFGPDYDEDAWHPDMTVYTVEELSKALASGGKIQVIGTLNAGATQDVPNWTNAPAEFIFDATTLDALKGGDYILDEGSKYGVVALISAGESLALSDMKITANSQWPVYLSNYGGNLDVSNVTIEAEAGAGIYPYGTNGTTVLNNVKVNQNYLDPAYSATTPWAATAVATSNGHNLVINSGTYIGSEWAVYGYNSGSTITINGGTFKAPKVIQLDGVWSGSNKSVATINGGNFDGSIYLDWGTNVPELYINGGNFTNFSATVCGAAKLVITGGSFDADPSAYVAEGYKAIDNGNGTWSVKAEGTELVTEGLYKKDNTYYIESANGLKYFSAKALTGNNGTAETAVIKLQADIDMGGAEFSAMIAQRGDTLTFNGNGHTISNVKIVSGAEDNTTGQAGMFYCYNDSTLNISDLILKDIVVTAEESDSGYAAAVVGYCEGAAVLNNVDVVTASVTGAKSSGILAGHVGNGGTLNAANCDVDGTITISDYEASGHYAGEYVGTIDGNTALTNCTAKVTLGGKLHANNVGGIFGRKVSGNLTIDGAECVADGLTKNGVVYFVYNANGLETLNKKMADQSAGRDVVVNLLADIDFTGKTWTPVDSHADTAFEIAEINGNGHTISNLTVNGQAMFTRFAGSGNVVIKDITFDKATVNSNGNINTSILTVQSYQNVLLDNVDVKNSSITGGYKVAPLIGTVYNESTSSITATLKNCDVENVVVTATVYDFCTTGMVAFVNAGNNDQIEFENCTVTNVKLIAPNDSYKAHAAVYTTGSESLFNETAGVTVNNVTFEAL